MTAKLVLGAALGQCVHLSGLEHFLKACESEGWRTLSLGPAVAGSRLLEAVAREKPEMVAVSYRLTAEDAKPLFEALRAGAAALPGPHPVWVCGGTQPVAEVARACGLFDRAFDGTEGLDAVLAYLRGGASASAQVAGADTLLERIAALHPMPLLRHHYGEPDLARTLEGAARIAESGVLDVLSVGPDQNAQECFFRPGEMDRSQDGAGGVPVRRPEDLEAIYRATRRGNHPLVRCYSGTRDLLRWAEMSVRTLRNAWGAIPLCWYSVMDGRSQVPFPDAIQEKLATMRFYAEQGIPLEVNESHQWSLREAHDSLAVAMAFLAAYNARAVGATDYVVQMMHNTPPGTSPAMDLAKMLAKLTLIGELEHAGFRTYREVRAGITSLPADPHEAKGHLAASAVFSMALRPHILHVVGYSEASRVVDPPTLIESCRIARGAIRLCLLGAPDPALDPAVVRRRDHLVAEARVLLEGIRRLDPACPEPWAEPRVLTAAIQRGLLDAPHFRGNPHLFGRILTANLHGGWEAIDPSSRLPLREEQRLAALGIAL